MRNRSLLENQTYIHQEAYQLIDNSIEEWLLDFSSVLWDSWFSCRKKMGDFLIVVCGCISLKARIQDQDAQQIRDILQRFRASIHPCDMTKWSDEDRRWIQKILQHPSFFGVSDGEKISLFRTAEFLDLPITAAQIETVQNLLEDQGSTFLQTPPKNKLELLIATEFQCAPNRKESLLLALLSQSPQIHMPLFLSDIHQVQAFCSGWACLEQERDIVSQLQSRLDEFSITSKWSYGDTRELFVLIAISQEDQDSDFSWGSRHIWVFEDLLSALQVLWELKPRKSKLIHSSCTYPYATECSDIFLDDGMSIDEISILGYESKDRIFLEGDFWSIGGVLEKSRTEDEEQRQQQANEELARFLLDAESDSVED